MRLVRAVRSAALLVFTLTLVSQPGCATREKPPELIALEKLRGDPTLSDSDRKAFDLLAAADDLLVQARGEWQGGNDERARRDALVGQIKMKMALAILQAQHARARISELDAETSLAEDEAARVTEELAIAREEVALLERLRVAKVAAAEEKKALAAQIDSARKQAATDRQKLADQLASQTQRADALDGLHKAELALRTADTVDARAYAKAKYTAATSMLQEAHKQFDAGKWAEVMERTGLAANEAEGATTQARPLYEKASIAMSDRARDRALEADASALPNVFTRLERQGDVQRLVLTLGSLFDPGKTDLAPKGAAVLDTIHDLLTKYPAYSVEITGYADGGPKGGDPTIVSLARANAVFWSLVKRGIDPKRMSVDTTPLTGADGAPRRNAPEGVELTLLYHIDRGA